jgi:tRNA (guanine10-N2)-dimethyltransferase
MVKSLCILGRQPALGLAELESLYGADAVSDFSSHAAGLDVDASQVDFSRLGGSTRLASVIGELESTAWPMVEKALRASLLLVEKDLPREGKIKLGISVYGLDISPAKLTAAGLTLKKVLRGEGRSVRLVPNQTAELSSAQVFHNSLTGELGVELLIVAGKNSTIIARTTAVQDIDSYTLRDRGRPKRDARVGMLPPKLAQIIINLAVGPKAFSDNEIHILDPFCGTGVVLQEALLMGYFVHGSDIEQRMIDYTLHNLEWLQKTYQPDGTILSIRQGDATSFKWIEANYVLDAVACETYLGRPFTATPNHQVLEQTVSDVNLILKKFLTNIHGQLPPGARLCLAVPAWQIAPGKFRHLPLIDSLADLGYERVQFAHVKNEDLLYYREDQIVARELLVLKAI